MKRTKAEKRARKAQHSARKVVEAHGQLEGRTLEVLQNLTQEVTMLRGAQENFRQLIFGAFLGRALGNEPTLSEALLTSRPELFKGMESEPWMAFREAP